MTPEEQIAELEAKNRRLCVLLAQGATNATEALGTLASRTHMLKGSLLEIGGLVANDCKGCFSPDHPCGDPICDLKRQVRDVVLRAIMEEETSGK